MATADHDRSHSRGRFYPVQREVLERRMEKVKTPYGDVPVKVGLYKGEVITRSPEHDACEALARAHGVTVRQVWPKADGK